MGNANKDWWPDDGFTTLVQTKKSQRLLDNFYEIFCMPYMAPIG